MPLGNLTSQFFANVYLNYFDHFVKRRLQAKHYIRYVDDFVILHKSREQLEIWKTKIDLFLNEKLKLQLHPYKSRIILLSKGIDFVGFRNFCHFKLLRKRSIKKMNNAIDKFGKELISYRQLTETFQGWQAHAKWADTFKLRKQIASKIAKEKHKRIEIIKNRKLKYDDLFDSE